MKKSYKGFILWIVVFMSGFLPLTNIPATGDMLTRMSLIYCGIMIVLLSYIIYRTDKIYWYNGISFEDAEKATVEQRAAYARSHLKAFLLFMLIYSIFTVITGFMKITSLVDILFFSVGLIITAISTIKIKLK